MIYGKHNAINYKKQKIIKLHKGMSPIYNNYIINAAKNKNNNNINFSNNLNLYENEKENKKNQYLTPNSISKTTKNSPRNIFYQYNHYNNKYKNNNNNHQIKYETTIQSPRKTFLNKLNFKAKKLNLNVKTLNMNLEINKCHNYNSSYYEDSNLKNLNNRNLSVIQANKYYNDDNSFITKDNKTKHDITKIQVNNLRNQLDKILSTKNRSRSSTKNKINNNKNKEKKEIENAFIFSDENSFVYDNNTLTENNKNYENRTKCILLKDKKIRKNIYINKKERKKRNGLNIKLFNSLKNNFIGIKLHNKKSIKNENDCNFSKNKFRYRNQGNRELRASKTEIENFENDSSSIIKVPKIIKQTKMETNSIEYEFNKNNDKWQISNKIYNINSIRSKSNENNIPNDSYNSNLEKNKKIITNKSRQKNYNIIKNEELENKYEVLIQSYKILKEENANLIQENKSLKKSNSFISEENAFLNNYILSIKKIIVTIISTYSKQITNLAQIVKNNVINSSSEYQNKMSKIKNVIYTYVSKELENKKRTNSLIAQLIQENKILRKILMNSRQDKNFLQEKQSYLDKDYKLNFNYNFLKNLNKIDKDFEKKLYLNISFNNNTNKNNSVKKKIKKEKYYDTDINYIKENNNKENNKMFEKKQIKYTKIKK